MKKASETVSSIVDIMQYRINAMEEETKRLRSRELELMIIVKDLCGDEIPLGYKEQIMDNLFKEYQ